MDTVNVFVTWLTGKSGVTITSDDSPSSVEFNINHATGIKHKEVIDELMSHDLWVVSGTPNTGLKPYKVADTKPDPMI